MEEKIEEPFNVVGKDCYAIQPELNEGNGKIRYTFRIDLMIYLVMPIMSIHIVHPSMRLPVLI